MINIRSAGHITVSWLLLPLVAHAQAQDVASDKSPFVDLLYAILPLLILGGLLFWFLRRFQSGPRARRTEQYMVRHEEHMARVEQSLERIAQALERKNSCSTGETSPPLDAR